MDASIKYRLFDALCRRYESGQATAGSLADEASGLIVAAQKICGLGIEPAGKGLLTGLIAELTSCAPNRMSFQEAMDSVRAGKAVARDSWPNGMAAGLCKEWNGKGLCIEGKDFTPLPFLYIIMPDGACSPWSAARDDAAANDWRVVSSELGTQSAAI